MNPPVGIIELSVWQLALALVLVAALVVVSVRQSLGLERDLVIGTVRAIVQLYAVGLILAAVFAAAHWYWVLVILGVMTGVATQAAVSRLRTPLPGAAWIAALALTVSTAATLAYVIGVVVQVRPWYEPQYIIPIAGMILGNSMTSAALAGDRLQSDLRARADEIEARLALGFSGREAVQPMVRAALRAAMIPTVNGMMTVGLVQLPGMMTGQILAGSSPLLAIRYQMVVVFMQGAATALGSLPCSSCAWPLVAISRRRSSSGAPCCSERASWPFRKGGRMRERVITRSARTVAATGRGKAKVSGTVSPQRGEQWEQRTGPGGAEREAEQKV
jgi:putative ABC transport system permease protein